MPDGKRLLRRLAIRDLVVTNARGLGPRDGYGSGRARNGRYFGRRELLVLRSLNIARPLRLGIERHDPVAFRHDHNAVGRAWLEIVDRHAIGVRNAATRKCLDRRLTVEDLVASRAVDRAPAEINRSWAGFIVVDDRLF